MERAADACTFTDVPMLERRLYFHIDWALIAAVLALCAIGVTMIYSTTGGPTRVYWTQLYAMALGLGAMGFALLIDYRTFGDKSRTIFYF